MRCYLLLRSENGVVLASRLLATQWSFAGYRGLGVGRGGMEVGK